MRLALSRATVSGPAGTWQNAVVLARNGRMVVRSSAGEVLLDAQADAVVVVQGGSWLVQTDGGTYSVVRERKGCGCG
jgi:hypothetical protein